MKNELILILFDHSITNLATIPCSRYTMISVPCVFSQNPTASISSRIVSSLQTDAFVIFRIITTLFSCPNTISYPLCTASHLVYTKVKGINLIICEVDLWKRHLTMPRRQGHGYLSPKFGSLLLYSNVKSIRLD